MRLHDAAANRLRGTSRGRRAFTLIELLVVILIVAILVAVALTSFLGQTTKAQDSGVKQHLTVARIEAKAYWTSQGQSGFAPAGTDPTTATSTVVAALNASEPSYDFVPDPFMVSPAGNTPTTSTSTIGVEVNPDDANEITFCQEAPDSTVFCLRTDELGQLLAVPGYENTAASAVNSLQNLVTPASAQAGSLPTTDVVRATGTGSTTPQAEANALCVLQAATPTIDGGTGSGDPSSCAPGGYAGWSTDPNSNGTTTSGSGSNGGAIPANTTSPSVTGSALTGSVLTGSPGVWSGDPFIYSYEWEDCSTSAGTTCTPISGAVGPTYTLKASDIGSYVFLNVAATNSTGTSGYTQSWDSIGPVISGIPAGGQPTITGTPWIGDQLTGSPGSWSNSPTSFSYQWESCTDVLAQDCTPIMGTAGQQSTYTLTSGNGGNYFVLEVTATNSDGASAVSISNILGPVIGVPSGGAPTISGSPYIGATLTGSPGTWTYTDDNSTYAYQWEDCTSAAGTGCTNISGANSSTYVVQATDADYYIFLTVTAADADGASAPVTTATGPGPVIGVPANTVAPTIVDSTTPGAFNVGDGLSASRGTWSYDPTSYSYQWYNCTSDSASSCAAIDGATGSTYTIGSSNAYLEVQIEATNVLGTSSPAISSIVGKSVALTLVSSASTPSYPNGLAVTPDSKFVGVANNNGASQTSANAVTMYSISSAGALTLASTASTGAGSDPNQVAFSPNDEYAAVANGGTNTVSTYGLASNGSLSLIGTYASGTDPEDDAYSPNSNFLVLVNNVSSTVETYSVGSGGTLSPASSAATGANPWSVAWSPNGQEVAVGNGDGTLDLYSVSATGALTLTQTVTPSAAGDVVRSVLFSPNGDYLGVVTYGANDIVMYSVNYSNNSLTEIGSYATGGTSPAFLAFSPSGNIVYVDNWTGNSVMSFVVDSNGSLTEFESLGVADNAPAFGITPNGDFLLIGLNGTPDVLDSLSVP